MATFKNPVHPGEILESEFLEPLGMSAGALAKVLDVPRTRIERIVKGTMGISTDTAFRLGRYFGTGPRVWINLQADYDIAIGDMQITPRLAGITPRPVEQTQAAE